MKKEELIFERYREGGIVAGGELLLTPSAAVQFVEDCRRLNLVILGMDFYTPRGEELVEMVGNSADFSSAATEPNAVELSCDAAKRFFEAEPLGDIARVSFVIKEKLDLDENILFYYNRGREQDRLERDLSRVEYLANPGRVGTLFTQTSGDHSRHRRRAGALRGLARGAGLRRGIAGPRAFARRTGSGCFAKFENAEAELGDARALPYRDNSADAALLLGPLYHLTERADRLGVLREAKRVLKPGGKLFAAVISRFASLLDGLSFGFLDDPAYKESVEHALETGVHQNPQRRVGLFTTAYFHHPEELKQEIEVAGLKLETLLGLEGPSRYLTDLDATLKDSQKTDTLLELLGTTEHEPSLLGVSPHILAVATAP